jgi:hypothetical protein|tara:strand:+ start:498 stop:614 length:117 start_codon:yes stop_codon:yes gene_type:complete
MTEDKSVKPPTIVLIDGTSLITNHTHAVPKTLSSKNIR